MIPNIPNDIPNTHKIEWAVKNLDKFCILPWVNLNTNPNGNIKLCCSIQLDTFVSDENVRAYNLGHDDIEKIWDSIYMRYVRERKRSALGANDCESCYSGEKISGHSPRTGQNAMWIDIKSRDDELANFFGNSLDKKYIEDQFLPQLPTSLELRLGNQCNLQCITCWGMSSSLIHGERTGYLEKNQMEDPKLGWLKETWKREKATVDNTDVTNWFDTDIFYNNFRKMAPTLRRLYTTGGEPTLIKSNYKMFELLLEAKNTKCSIEFTSNMTSWNHSFYSKLEKFENVEIQMSIDGTDNVGEYIRYPSNFEKVRENVNRAVELASTRPGWRIKCYTVLQALNFKHLIPIWQLLHEMSVKHDIHIDWWPITLAAPEFLSLGAIKQPVRSEYIEQLNKDSEKFRAYNENIPNKFVVNDDTYGACKDAILNTKFDPLLKERLKYYIEFNDRTRTLNGAELFKDIL